MKNKTRKFLAAIVFICLAHTAGAQESVNASGGDASGSGGSASYSVGQVVYTTNTGTNGSVAQGVQQPYEISVITVLEEAVGIHLSMSVYPNPATDILILNIGDFRPDNMLFALYDIHGKILQQQDVLQQESHINVGIYPVGTYILRIISNNREIKSFKIIKTR